MKDNIKRLARELNAIILAHNYQPPEIQDIADMCGDSLELSIKAANNDADVIVFCGVRFMAETASILSPNKTVLLPESSASCPMVDMVSTDDLLEHLNSFYKMPIVTYVNSSAEIKALTTICCTSANAALIVDSLDEEEILMVPDRNLAMNTAKLTKKKIHLWNGFCPVHDRLTLDEVMQAKKDHPGAVFIAHPECKPEVTKVADVILSTSGMIKYVSISDTMEFIIGTETGILYPMIKENPLKIFYPAARHMICPDMKMTTLKSVLTSLENMSEVIRIPEGTRLPAMKALKRMIELSK